MGLRKIVVIQAECDKCDEKSLPMESRMLQIQLGLDDWLVKKEKDGNFTVLCAGCKYKRKETTNA